jgi:predicted dehydrogenase
MVDQTTVVLAGVAGYGKMYLRHLLDAQRQATAANANGNGNGHATAPYPFRIVGVADPRATACERYGEVRAARIPVYHTLEEFYERHTADIAVIATPVQLHTRHICLALSRGSHVLCEKPLASSYQDAARVHHARNAAGRHVAIGYQWSYCPAIRALKRDIASGLLGRPRRMRTLVLWPRGEEYFARNPWAGRLQDEAGLPVLDSPLHNACAHFVHNAFHVLGDALDPAAYPSRVLAELYRAHAIENYDTAVVRCTIGDGGMNGEGTGVEAMFIASHAVPRRNGPVFCYEFDDATVTYDDAKMSEGVVARFKNGDVKRYGVPATSDNPAKLWHIFECARTGRAPLCGIEAALAQTACILAAQESMPQICAFDRADVTIERGDMGRLHYPRGLQEELEDCYAKFETPSERRLPWARSGLAVTPKLASEVLTPGVNGAKVRVHVKTHQVSRRPLQEPV